MILVVGEILFDMFPDGKRLGGAPFNFAFHLKKLGFPVRLISRVGRDDLGREILDFLDRHGFDCRDIQQDPDRKTGTVTVTMGPEKNHAFTITENAAWDHIDFNPVIQAVADSGLRMIYFGTLVQRTAPSREGLHAVLAEKPSAVRSFCDINLRPGGYGPAIIKASLQAADILKLNTDELLTLAGPKGRRACFDLSARGLMRDHAIHSLILTMGEQGSQWFAPQGHYQARPEPVTRMVDTVGAGDAYAAMAAAGILTGFSPERILPLAGRFAAHVCGIRGALIQDDNIYRDFKARLEAAHGG